MRWEELEDTTVRAWVLEDNQSAYYLATNHWITNRTKHFQIKWHWFWDQYHQGHFQVIKCPTTEQNADFLTKNLSKDLFEKNRKHVMGW